MQVLNYNRQTNNKVYYFGVLTIPDIFIGLIVSMLSLALFKMPILMLIYMICHMTYLGLLRAGKPNGYDAHLFAALGTPKILRPAKIDPVHPIKTPSK